MTTELPTIPHASEPGRADYPLNLKEPLSKLPAFEALCAAAREEMLIQEAKKRFSRPQAEADHEAATAELRKNPTPENLEALKTLGGLESRRRAYAEHEGALSEDIRSLRKKNLPVLEEVTRIIIEVYLLRAREARAEIEAVFEKHKLPTPAPETIEAPFWNTARWHKHNLQLTRDGYGMNFDQYIQQLVGI